MINQRCVKSRYFVCLGTAFEGCFSCFFRSLERTFLKGELAEFPKLISVDGKSQILSEEMLEVLTCNTPAVLGLGPQE